MLRDDTVLTSYAQNAEDVLLWRVLRTVDPAEGFWIDIGANDPVVDSVTKMLSLRGWRGVNVEPVAHLHDALVRDRPGDVNVHAAVGDRAGELTLHRVLDNDALSTFDDGLAAFYRSKGLAVTDEQVAVCTLAEVFDRHAEGRTVHLLKIDVEGHEAAVVDGADWQRHRPWVVLIEATYPERWRANLERAGYRFVLDDGINFVFVAEEHPELVEPLSRPAVRALDPYLRFQDLAGDHHGAFVREHAVAHVAGLLLGSSNDDGARDAALALARIVCERPDLTAAFAGSGRLDVGAVLAWATDTPASSDSHLGLLERHQPALRRLAGR